jgi:hypothetical protein
LRFLGASNDARAPRGAKLRSKQTIDKNKKHRRSYQCIVYFVPGEQAPVRKITPRQLALWYWLMVVIYLCGFAAAGLVLWPT